MPGQDGVEVHLLEARAAVVDHPARHDLEADDHVGGVASIVGLDEADDDVGAAFETAMRLAEHGVGLAHAGRGTEVDAKPPAGHTSIVDRALGLLVLPEGIDCGRPPISPGSPAPGSARGRSRGARR